MLSRNHPDGIHIAFDDHRLVNNAGLILPATLALHLGLPQLVDRHLDLGRAPGRANTGDKMMTLVVRVGTASTTLTCCAPGGPHAPWAVWSRRPLGTFLRSFRWGHVRQLDEPRVAGPGLEGRCRTRRRPIQSTLIRRSDLRAGQKALATTATPASGAITRCWPVLT